MSDRISVRRQVVAVVVLLAILGIVAGLITTSNFNRDRYAEQEALKQPRLVSSQPGAGEELPPDGAIRLTFDMPMDRASVEHAVTLNPPVPFATHWDSDLSVDILLQAGRLRPSSRLTLTLDTSARAQTGWALLEARQIKLDTPGFLRVTDLSPTSGKDELPQDTSIRVMFNRPVVSLAPMNDRSQQPNPLTLSPATEGHGEWINTSIYEWHPDKPLHSGQKYSAVLDPSLVDLSGAKLDKNYITKFTIVAPRIVSVSPNSSKKTSRYYDEPDTFPLNTAIDVIFNIPMDRASTEAAFSLATEGGLPFGTGQFSWNDESTHLTFQPSSLLALDGAYRITLSKDARSADGYGQLPRESVTNFKTAPAPKVVGADWGQRSDMSPYFNESIRFNTLMDEDTLVEQGRVTISPEPPEPLTLSSWSYGNGSILHFSARLRGRTRYTVTVNPGAKDIYGNRIDEPYTYSFTTRPYSARVQINTGGRFGVYDASNPTRIVLATRSVSKVDLSLYKLTMDEFARVRNRDNKYSPSKDALIRSWTETLISPDDDAMITPISVAPDGGALAPGIYWLKTSYAHDRYAYQYQPDHFLFVVNANLTYKVSPRQAMVWLTDLHNAQPISGAPVTVYNQTGDSKSPLDQTSGVTADDGTAFISVKARAYEDPWLYDYYGPSSFAVVDDGQTFAIALTSWEEGITPYSFGISETGNHSDQTLYLYTDRPIYRPGQEVYFRGILRDRDDMVFSLPKQTDVRVNISHYDQGKTQELHPETYTVDEMGVFHGSLTLPENAASGRYYVKVDTGGTRYENQACVYYYYCGDRADAYFDVQEYRKPEFDVKITPEQTDILAGDSTSVTMSAEFFSGGPVSNAKVSWRVKSYSSAFSYSGPGRYRFSDYRQYWSYFYYDYGYSRSEELDSYYIVAEGEGVTDGNGRLVIPFTTPENAGTNELMVEAEVEDIGGVPVSGATRVMSHDAEYYVGVASDSYWNEVGQPQTMRLLVVDWAGKPVSGQTVSIELSQQTYNRKRTYSDEGSVSWVWTTVDNPVGEAQTAITDERGQAEIAITPPGPGSYRVRASVTDPRDNTHTSSAFLWASSYTYTLLRSSDTDDQTDIIPDRASYQPGETATILINNPFQGDVQALVTVERESVLSHEVVTLTEGAGRYQIPITAAHAPDVYVSAMLLKGIDDTSPTPDFKMGLTKLKILPSAQTLTVSVTPEADVVMPGQPAKFQIQVADQAGQPASAQVSLALVDAAVLKLAKPNSINILDHFYGERLLGVSTAQPLTALVDRLLVEIIPDNIDGRGGGGGGGPDIRLPDAVREDFKDTAYWNATIQTDAEGRAEVTVPMPDNLTIWRLDARAVTADTHVGQGEAEVQATLPLIIRPETPRFFIAGDRATLSAIVNNNTSQDIDAVVKLDSNGLKLEDLARQTVTIPAHNRQIVTWQAQVDMKADWVDVIFRAEGGGYSDAARPEIGDEQHDRMLPVFRYEVFEPVGTAGQLTYGGSRTEYVSLPPGLDTSRGSLSVQVQHSLAASTLDGLSWLKHYPYECNEQFTSRLLPNSVTLAALRDLGVSDPVLEKELTEQRDIGVSTLLKRQKVSGGWGLWEEDDPSPLVTAYVLHGLLEANKVGADIDSAKVSKAIGYLSRWLSGSPERKEGGFNLRVYVVYVLSRAAEFEPPAEPTPTARPTGRPKPEPTPKPSTPGARNGTKSMEKAVDEAISQLYESRDDLNIYGKALLAQAMWNRRPNDLRLGTLRSDLTETAIVSATTTHWEEDSYDYWNWNTDVRTTAIVLDTFTKIWPNSNLGPGATRWLVTMRKMDHWSTTQETAWSLLALTDWMRATHELEGSYPWKLTLGGRELSSGSVSPATLAQTTRVDINLDEFLANDNYTIERGDGPGRLYYTGQLVTYPDVETVTQVSNGVSISHRYLDGEGRPVTEARVGDTLTVEVTIVAPKSLHYPIIEDYYPAGAEPLNPELLSQPLADKRPTLQGQDDYGWRWGWSWFSHVEMRDEKALVSTRYLPSGTYQLRYQVWLNTPGDFHVIPPTVWEFYVPDVYGRGDGQMFRVLPAN